MLCGQPPARWHGAGGPQCGSTSRGEKYPAEFRNAVGGDDGRPHEEHPPRQGWRLASTPKLTGQAAP